MELIELLQTARPNARESTLKAYVAVLTKMKKDFKSDNFNFLENYEDVMEYLNKSKLTTIKNKLTAIIVYMKAKKKNADKYQKKLEELSKEYMEKLKDQTKTQTQEQNWVEFEELQKLSDKLLQNIKPLKKKEKLNKREYDKLQQAVILATYLVFPIRNDYADMKVIKKKELKKASDKKNYLVLDKNKKYFHINNYKTSKSLGSKVLEVPKHLNKILNIWLKRNTSGFFLTQTNMEAPMNPNNITKYLNKIFKKHLGKKISSSMIRHISISKDLQNKKTIREQEEEKKQAENKYMHSQNMNHLYRKVDE